MSGRYELQEKTLNSVQKKIETMPEYMQRWYENLVASDESPETIYDYVNKVKKLLQFVNKNDINVSPDEITEDKVVSFFINLRLKVINGEKVKTSDSYQISYWHCLNNFFEFMSERGYITKNYMTTIKKPKNRDLTRINRERINITKEDLNEIIKAVDEGVGSHKAKEFQKQTKDRDKLIILLLISTGMRKTALSEIDIDDIDFEENELILVDKGEKEHIYTLNQSVMDTLNAWIEKRTELCDISQRALFVSRQGTRMTGTAIAKVTKKYSDAAIDCELSPHKFRSAFCSILYNETGDIEFVRRAVGHSNVSTTQRYVVTKSKEKERAAEIMQGIFN